MELRHLRYFVAVAEGLNFRRAAARLGVAQPALSKQIKSMEDEIGVRLLDRNTGGVALTDAGATFLDESRDILERVEMAQKAARDAALGTSGRLAIGSLGVVTASFLPSALAAFRARYPKVEVTLHEAPVSEQIQALQNGTVQVAFATRHLALANASAFASASAMSARLVVALGQNHRFAPHTGGVALSDLAEESLLCIGGTERHQQHRDIVESILNKRGIRHHPIRRVNGFESLVALVAAGHGVSLLLPFAPAHRPEGLLFRKVRDSGTDLTVEISALWSKRSKSQLVRNFIDVLGRHASTA
jgi:DNA-binding transcriptional LysR family regulator